MDESLTSTALGRYQLVRRIGRGGMGEVWLAGDPRLQRQVAIKVLPLRKRDDQEFLVRFEREARAAASLHHPHILPVHDYGQQQMPDDQTVTYLKLSITHILMALSIAISNPPICCCARTTGCC